MPQGSIGALSRYDFQFCAGGPLVGRSIADFQLIGNRAGGLAKMLIDGAAHVLPNLQLFFPSGTIVGAERVTVNGAFVDGAYMTSATVYGVGYSVLALIAAIVIFGRRDFV